MTASGEAIVFLDRLACTDHRLAQRITIVTESELKDLSNQYGLSMQLEQYISKGMIHK
jgi:hypothetical protein